MDWCYIEKNSEGEELVLRWVWLPFFLATNSILQKELVNELNTLYAGKELTPELNTEINNCVVDFMSRKVGLIGLDKYLKAVEEVVLLD